MESLSFCVSCEKLFVPTTGQRCAACQDILAFRGRYGSLLVVGVLTQRELAMLKREFYELENIVRALEERKAEFMRKAIEQAEQLVRDVEAELGKPVKELRDRRDLLKTKLQEYMSQSGTTHMRIRNLLLELKREIVNPGNRPQPTKVYEELRKLAGLTEEELREIVRASYSQPQWGERLYVTPIPSGKKQKTEPKESEPESNPETKSGSRKMAIVRYAADELTVPRMAEIEREFMRSAASVCRIDSPEGIFILTGDFVRKNGVAYMVGLQKRTKASLTVQDIEKRHDGTIYMLIEGAFARDPNTVRAFLADRMPDYEIRDVLYPSDTRVALELVPAGTRDMTQQALEFFDQMDQVLSHLLSTDRAREQIASGLPMYVTGTGTPTDLVDNTEDFLLSYERQNTNPSGTGYRGIPQEGIMSPENDPSTVSLSAVGCSVCTRKLTATNRDPVDQAMCVWCGLEQSMRA
jgi:hypothetical protein